MCVYGRVCFRHPAPSAAANGRVCPAQRLVRASQAKSRTAPGARRARRQPDPAVLLPLAGRAAPPGLHLRAAGTRPPTTAKKKVQLWGLSESYPCRGGRRPQSREPRGSALDGAARFQHPATLLPELLEQRKKSPGEGTQWPAGPLPRAEGKGRSPRRGSYRWLGAPRAGPGPRRLSARLRAPGARAAGHAVGAGGAGRVRPCGSGLLPPPLLLPPVSARGGLSRRSRSSPHATD